MAAAIIPLVLSSLPSIISLITGLVHQHAPVAEAQRGPGTGPVKFADVFEFVITALQAAAKAGTIDKNLPSDEEIKMIIQSVISSLNMQGALGGSAAPSVVGKSAGSMVITIQPITLSVAFK